MAQMRCGNCLNLEAEPDLLDRLMPMSSAAGLTGNFLLSESYQIIFDNIYEVDHDITFIVMTI